MEKAGQLQIHILSSRSDLTYLPEKVLLIAWRVQRPRNCLWCWFVSCQTWEPSELLAPVFHCPGLSSSDTSSEQPSLHSLERSQQAQQLSFTNSCFDFLYWVSHSLKCRLICYLPLQRGKDHTRPHPQPRTAPGPRCRGLQTVR